MSRSIRLLPLLCLALAFPLMGMDCGAPITPNAPSSRIVAGGEVPPPMMEWPAGSDVMLEEDLDVLGILEIGPGTTVTVSEGVGIRVAGRGALRILGEAGSRVRFTTLGSDRWTGIAVEAGGELTATHAVLENLIDSAVRSEGGVVRIEDSRIRDVDAGADGDAVGLSFTGGLAAVHRTSIFDIEGDDGVAGTPGLDGGASINPVAASDGDDGDAGGAGGPGADGGSATGIYVGPGTTAELVDNQIEDIDAGLGGDGGLGGAGGDGAPGGSGATLEAGGNGGAGGLGAAGGAGGDGGAARGLWLDEAATVALLDQRIVDVSGGHGGRGADGGRGGAGGAGGSGGDQAAAPDLPGAGGQAGAGGAGGLGGDGGHGGEALGVDADASRIDGVLQHLVADVRAGSAGAGGSGGAGGDGADGGAGGASATADIDGAAGGAGADAGDGGDGGHGGAGADAAALRIFDGVGSDLVTLNTIADVEAGRGADAGLAGDGGAAGVGGAGGGGDAPDDANDAGPDGGAGLGADPGIDGFEGTGGHAVGILARVGSDVTVRNTVIDLDSPGDGVALMAVDAAVIGSNFNLFDGVATVSSGAVSLGARDRELDPELIDPSGGDYRPGPDSPAIDAGDNGFSPGSLVLDLAGEPRRVDDPGTPNTGAGTAPIVDIGAYEFQPPSCDTDPSELWPPNHRMVDVTVAIDLGTIEPLQPNIMVYASSDEPDNSNGDGNTTGDVNGSDGYSASVNVTPEFAGSIGVVQLRSERRGPGDGREYTLDVHLDGPDMDPREFSCGVVVPHDQGN